MNKRINVSHFLGWIPEEGLLGHVVGNSQYMRYKSTFPCMGLLGNLFKRYRLNTIHILPFNPSFFLPLSVWNVDVMGMEQPPGSLRTKAQDSGTGTRKEPGCLMTVLRRCKALDGLAVWKWQSLFKYITLGSFLLLSAKPKSGWLNFIQEERYQTKSINKKESGGQR